QHEDGHSHVLAGTIPNCISYDPAYGYEIAVIVQDGMRRMVEDQEDIFYYLTIMNEAYQQPAMPERKNLAKEIVQGLYCLETGKPAKKKHRVQLMGSGTILNEVRAAATILRDDFDIEADIWSATSFNELRREALEVSRQNRLNPDKPAEKSFVEKQLEGHEGPVIAASDYMKIYADQLREFIPGTFIALGTDGFGRSDTREKLRHFFEVDRYFITVTALYALVKENKITASVVSKAMQRFGISKDKISAMHC
ncbi:MAG: pyruvate dehydrogenase (acetyl-transferring), homodimeric type, partial [Endozoicomonadaceae bacterium]|nr:pyruvate dehydrogenase (acetyl-transferring), homodimeric type [Endozoicomonadaceae bacterium]